MRRLTVALLVSFAWHGLVAAQVSWAQGYTPATPTLSPWLNLQRRDPGPLGGYLSDVRPQIELNNTLRQQGNGIYANTANLTTLGQQVRQSGPRQAVRPTGTASVYMNYSHYYPALGSATGGFVGTPPAPLPAVGGMATLPPAMPASGAGAGMGMGMGRY
jgi:hypothetical protein